jgi:hypothetical protein
MDPNAYDPNHQTAATVGAGAQGHVADDELRALIPASRDVRRRAFTDLLRTIARASQ